MEGASEYVVLAGADATFEALREAVLVRGLRVVENDPLHRRLAFRLAQPHEGEQTKALCAILDGGRGLTKIVVVCVDLGGGVAPLDPSLQGLFMQVEHILHTASGGRRAVALPSSRDGVLITEGATP
jgi:hypothetical protein